MECTSNPHTHAHGNKGKLVRPKDVCAIRVRLEMERWAGGPALFDLGIDSKLRTCTA